MLRRAARAQTSATLHSPRARSAVSHNPPMTYRARTASGAPTATTPPNTRSAPRWARNHQIPTAEKESPPSPITRITSPPAPSPVSRSTTAAAAVPSAHRARSLASPVGSSDPFTVTVPTSMLNVHVPASPDPAV